MKKYFTKEVKIGIMAVAGVVILFVGMNFLKGIIVMSDDARYNVIVNNLNGLTKSSPVFADGYQVGVVRSIDYNYDEPGKDIIVDIAVKRDLRIPLGSKAEIDSDIMGNVKLNILFANNPRQRVEEGGVIEGGLATGALDKLQTMVPYIEAMLPKMDSILTSINILLADPAIAATLHNAQSVSSNLVTTTAEVNRLMAQLNQQVPGMMKKADATLDNTQQLTANLSQVDIAGTMADVNATLKNVRELTEKINSANGTVGKFLNDPSVYDNLNATMKSADSLMIDLKSHPKRYVHFSIFGKKDN